MWMLEIPPFIPFFIGALIAGFTRGTVRSAIMVMTPILGALHLWMVPEGVHLQIAFLDYQLTPYRVDKLSLMFGYVFHIAAFIAIVLLAACSRYATTSRSLCYTQAAVWALFLQETC